MGSSAVRQKVVAPLATEKIDITPTWPRQVGEHTRPHRLARAERHNEIAELARGRAAHLLELAQSTPFLGPLDPKHGATLADAQSSAKGFRDHYEERSALFARAVWHERRARAELDRIERVEACQTEEYARVCDGCGDVSQDDGEQHFTRCESWQYCVSCKGSRCADLRGRFDDSATEWRKVYRREMESPFRRWSEKLATFTVPHSGSATRDLAILYVCFRRFFPVIREWLRASDSRARCINEPGTPGYVSPPTLPYLRVFELTGSDAGHAHLHTWLLGPYLPHWVARIEWGKSIGYCGARKEHAGLTASYLPVRHIDDVLADVMPIGPECFGTCAHCSCKRNRFTRRAASKQIHELATVQHGRRIQWLPWPVVDIREAHGVGAELVKYLTKDIGPSGEHVDPAEYAHLLEATVGRRLVCASLSFWYEPPRRVCACCELTYKRVRIELPELGSAGGARAPPL